MAHQIKNLKLPTEQSSISLPLCLFARREQFMHNVWCAVLKILEGSIGTLELCLLGEAPSKLPVLHLLDYGLYS